MNIWSKFRLLKKDEREEIKAAFSFYDGDDDSFMEYIRERGREIEVMWLVIDPMNPLDPRNSL